MKIRTGFVSNSSSSSFTCGVCGENQSGMDVGLSDCEMTQCVQGHIYCDSHQTKEELTTQDKRDFVDQKWAAEYYKERLVKAQALDDASFEDWWEGLMGEDIRYESPSALCPICQFTKLTSADCQKFLLKKLGLTPEQVLAEMKSTFGTYAKFAEAFKEKK